MDIQIAMQSKMDFQNYANLQNLTLVAGVGLAHWNKNELEYAIYCIVLGDFNTKNIVESKYCIDKVVMPYIPGCLAFREVPLFLKTKCLLNNVPDIYFFKGNGYLHPRHMGIATHAGSAPAPTAACPEGSTTLTEGLQRRYCRLSMHGEAHSRRATAIPMTGQDGACRRPHPAESCTNGTPMTRRGMS